MQSSFTNLQVFDQPPDIELRVPGGRSFHVHQVILEASSIRLKAVVERARVQVEKAVELLNLDGDTAERMLRYVYLSQEPPEGLDFESLLKLYVAAEDYALEALINVCSVRLGKELNHANLLRAVKLAGRYNNSYIKQKIRDFVLAHGLGNYDQKEMQEILVERIMKT